MAPLASSVPRGDMAAAAGSELEITLEHPQGASSQGARCLLAGKEMSSRRSPIWLEHAWLLTKELFFWWQGSAGGAGASQHQSSGLSRAALLRAASSLCSPRGTNVQQITGF